MVVVHVAAASPRFDTWEAALANTASIAVLLLAIVLLWRARRTDRPPSWGMWIICLAHFSMNGIYLPIGPLLVLVPLVSHLLEHPQDPPGRVWRVSASRWWRQAARQQAG